MHVLLIRFGLIALGIGVVAVIVFAVALRMRRNGRQADVRRYAETAMNLWANRSRCGRDHR